MEENGFKVDSFTDSTSALDNYQNYFYDLVLLDIKMPKMDGMLLYEKLKNIDPSLLFCFITANKEFIERIKRYNLDIEKSVIYKPIWLSELRSKVHSLLSNQQQQQQNEDKDKLLILTSIFSSDILVSSNLIPYH